MQVGSRCPCAQRCYSWGVSSVCLPAEECVQESVPRERRVPSQCVHRPAGRLLHCIACMLTYTCVLRARTLCGAPRLRAYLSVALLCGMGLDWAYACPRVAAAWPPFVWLPVRCTGCGGTRAHHLGGCGRMKLNFTDACLHRSPKGTTSPGCGRCARSPALAFLPLFAPRCRVAAPLFCSVCPLLWTSVCDMRACRAKDLHQS